MYLFQRRIAIQIILLILLVIIIFLLLYSIYILKKDNYSALANKMADRERKKLHIMKPCPLCNTLLRSKERVRTIIFQSNRTDCHVHVLGCPHCYPAAEKKPRICPVCRKSLPQDGYVIAQLMKRKKPHRLHILGCTICKTKRLYNPMSHHSSNSHGVP